RRAGRASSARPPTTSTPRRRARSPTWAGRTCGSGCRWRGGSTDVRRRLVLVLGVVTLLLATALAGSLAWTVLREPVTTSFGGVTVSTEGFGAVIAADLVITPRVRATFEGLDGTLLVGEQRVDYTLDGV